jgi:hypothetical protein
VEGDVEDVAGEVMLGGVMLWRVKKIGKRVIVVEICMIVIS